MALLYTKMVFITGKICLYFIYIGKCMYVHVHVCELFVANISN